MLALLRLTLVGSEQRKGVRSLETNVCLCEMFVLIRLLRIYALTRIRNKQAKFKLRQECRCLCYRLPAWNVTYTTLIHQALSGHALGYLAINCCLVTDARPKNCAWLTLERFS